MDHARRIARSAAPSLLALSLLAGCAQVSPVEPVPEAAPAPVVSGDAVPPPPSRLFAPLPDDTSPSVKTAPALLSWYTICEKDVIAGRVEEVRANRYQLVFARGSLASDIAFTMREYDQDVLDLELGPHGTQFGEPVTLSIDFSGTAADPLSGIADGSEPVLWWWNDVRLRWEEVPGRTDWESRRHIVRLAHFSRYVLGGKAGWKHEPRTESE